MSDDNGAGPGVSGEQPATQDPRRLLALAGNYHRAGQLAAAERLYRELIAAWPETAEAHRRLGMLYAQSGRFDDAVRHIATAVDLVPSNPRYAHDLGQALHAAKQYAAAADAYRRAIDLHPDLAEAHLQLGDILRLQGKAEEAAASYRRAIAAAPREPKAHIHLGLLLHDQRAYDAALAELRQAVAIDPQSFLGHYNLAVTLAAQRRDEEAIAAYRDALAVNPHVVSAYINLGLLLKIQGQHDEAIACCERAVGLAPEAAQGYINLATTLHAKGDLARAAAVMRRATAVEPGNAMAHANLGQILRELGDIAGAETSLRQALAIDPAQVFAKAHLSIVLQQHGKHDEAERLLDYPNLMRTRHIEAIDGWADTREFNTALAQHIHRHPTLMRDPPGKAIRHGSQTLEILNGSDRSIATLQRFFEQSVADYIATALCRADYPYAPPRPAGFHLEGWAVVLRSSGYQLAHFHHGAIVSGVYYVQIPDVVKSGKAGDAGFLRFGEPIVGTAGAALGRELLTRSVRPQEGMLVLFPSFYWHNVVAFDCREDRICIAFDVIAEQ